MTHTFNDQATVRRLLQFGTGLFLLGLLTGFMMPLFANPRMGLASHLEGVMNGMFLISMGLLWTHLNLGSAMKRLVIGLAIFGTFSNWLATLLAAFWGAGSMMAIASGGLAGTPWQEIIITVLLFALSFAMIAVSLLLLYGLRATRSDYATSTLITE